MNIALQEAENAYNRGSIPVGVVIVKNGEIISSFGNEVIKNNDSTAHAEILAIRKAEQILQSKLLENCDIYVTLEPCAMCAQAISLAKIKNLYFGAYNTKYGAIIHGAHIFHYSLQKPNVIGGISESNCVKILKNFFKNKRF